MTKITAGRGTLNARDFIRSLIVAAISPVFPIVMDSINAGDFALNWKHIWMTAAGAAFAYLVKNLLTPSEVVITDPAKVEAVKQGETIVVTPKVKE